MMHPALAGLIDRYQPKSSKDYENAVREIVQEIAPFLKDPRELSLWSAEFFTQWILGLKARVTPKSDRLWTSGM